jgi:TRAP-type transport system periplasmic protein
MSSSERRRPGRWLIALGLLLAALPLAAQQIKIATVAPEGSAWMREMRAAAKQAEAATEGRVTIKYYPGGVMGNDATVLKKIKLGQLQGGALTGSELGGVYRNAPLYSVPFLFRSMAEVDAVRAEFDARLADGLQAAGFRMLSLSGVGFAYLMSSGDIGTREALAQRKVWVPQNDVLAERTFRAGGIAPIPLALPDVFTGLQTGLVDTVGNTPAGAIALQWHGSLRQLLDLPLSYVVGYVVVDERTWKKLSADDQAATLQAFAEASARIDAGNRDSDAQALAALVELGVKKVAPGTGEITRWETIGREVIDTLVAEKALDAELVAPLRQKLASLRGAASAP